MADATTSDLAASYSAAAPAPKANMGQPVPRYDARAKVTGSALYASDVALPDVAYAFLVSSAIAKGRIRSFDLREARALPGVLDILTHETIGDAIRPVKFFTEGGPASNSVVPLGSPEIAYGGQTVAVVLANSYEVARDAAHRVVVDYEIDRPSATFASPGVVDQDLATQNKKHDDPKVGDFAVPTRRRPSRSTSPIRPRRSTTTRSSSSPPSAPGTARSSPSTSRARTSTASRTASPPNSGSNRAGSASSARSSEAPSARKVR